MSLHTSSPSTKSLNPANELSTLDATATQLENALRLVGDKYSLQIIYLLLKYEAQRFVELENAIQFVKGHDTTMDQDEKNIRFALRPTRIWKPSA